MPRKLPRGAAKAGTQKKSGPGTVNTDKVYNYRIAIDFGTTFTSVAFIRTDVQKVLTIENFPKDPAPDKNYTQVPTEIWYQHGAAKHAVPASATSPLPEVKCGYEARDHMRLPDAELTELGYRSDGYVTKPKLLLDQSTHLQEIQGNLMSVVRQLESNHLIKNGEDIIERLITYYLEHTKRVLIRDNNYSKDSDVEVTFCVPVCWSAAAVAVMSACVQKAMKSVGLGRNGIHKIFVVNEAEAAAMCV